MNRLILSLIGAGVALCGAASINPAARLAMTHQAADARAAVHTLDADPLPERVLPVIIKLAEGSTVADLPAEVTVVCGRANLVVAYVPVSMLDGLGADKSVIRLEASLSALPTLDIARGVSNVDKVAAGVDLPFGFTGRGVVAGFCDVGFDPNHAAFIDEATGENRVKSLVHFGDDPLQPITQLSSPQEIADYTTDDPDIWHATHVAGILAGGYHGNPYYGVAPGADIVATTSLLYEAQLLAGVESVIDYANSVGKPAVVNISISSSTGPRDGSTLFNQYMEMAARDAAVCISAGNDGQKRGYIGRRFSPSAKPISTYFVSHPSGSGRAISGYVSAWNSTDRALEVKLLIYDYFNRRLVAEIPVEITGDTGEALFCSASMAEAFGCEPAEYFTDYFDGYAWVSWELNPENNRYNVLLGMDYTTEWDPDFGAHNFLGVSVGALDGDFVDLYASESIYFGAFNDSDRGTTDQQINDFCAGRGPICVGGYASRDHWPRLDGEEHTSAGTAPAPGVFIHNSYGDLPDGTHLPHICAPGSYLVSAISEPYLQAHPDKEYRTTHVEDVYGRTNHWIAECGTSMSSPYLAGVFALWLEADPTLTPDDLLDIAIQTAIPPVNNPDDPRWGAGTVDAYTGLQAVLGRTGVAEVAPDIPSGSVPVYDLTGRRVATIDPAVGISTSLAPGIYVTPTGKIRVR